MIRTEGENGEKLLRRLITADVAKHATGDCLLASMLNASGGVMQEVAVIAHTGYWDVVLFPETADTGLAWSRQGSVSFEWSSRKTVMYSGLAVRLHPTR